MYAVSASGECLTKSLCRFMCCFMQKNQIQKIDGLENLANLQKLYLEDNKISCVENLQNCTALQELHLSRQRLPGDLELAFDQTCLEVNWPGLTKVWDVHILSVSQRLDTGRLQLSRTKFSVCTAMCTGICMLCM